MKASSAVEAARGRGRMSASLTDPGPAISLLLFEAAGCLMALPAAEVTQVLMPDATRHGARPDGVDLSAYLGAGRSTGPWVTWSRGTRTATLRIDRVVEVLSCAVRALTPLPSRLRVEHATRGRSVFWAAGVRGDEVFLLMDPARIEERREG